MAHRQSAEPLRIRGVRIAVGRVAVGFDNQIPISGWQPRRGLGAGQDQPRSRIVQHQRQPRRWIGKVKRQIRSPCLEDREQTHDHLRRPLDAQPDQLLWADASADQHVR